MCVCVVCVCIPLHPLCSARDVHARRQEQSHGHRRLWTECSRVCMCEWGTTWHGITWHAMRCHVMSCDVWERVHVCPRDIPAPHPHSRIRIRIRIPIPNSTSAFPSLAWRHAQPSEGQQHHATPHNTTQHTRHTRHSNTATTTQHTQQDNITCARVATSVQLSGASIRTPAHTH